MMSSDTDIEPRRGATSPGMRTLFAGHTFFAGYFRRRPRKVRRSDGSTIDLHDVKLWLITSKTCSCDRTS
jgi:hypothetical protein